MFNKWIIHNFKKKSKKNEFNDMVNEKILVLIKLKKYLIFYISKIFCV